GLEAMTGELHPEREFVGDQLAEENGARLLPAPHARGVVVRQPVGQQRRAAGGPDAAREIDVLVRDRDAEQRPRVAMTQRLLGRARVGAGAVGGQRDERRQHGIELLDPGEQRLRDLDGRELPGAVPRAELADRRVGDLVAHGCSPPPVANRTAGSTVLLARESRARTGASASLRSLRTIASRFSAIVTPAARMRWRTSSSVSSSDRSMTRLLARSHGAASGPRVTAPGV